MITALGFVIALACIISLAYLITQEGLFKFFENVVNALKDILNIILYGKDGKQPGKTSEPEPLPIEYEFKESLHANLLEHEILAPRSVEAWGHAPFYCNVCWPEEFEQLRAHGIYADMLFIPPVPKQALQMDRQPEPEMRYWRGVDGQVRFAPRTCSNGHTYTFDSYACQICGHISEEGRTVAENMAPRISTETGKRG